MSESIAHLANALLDDWDWDPKELYSPLCLELPKKKKLPDDIPQAKAKQLVVNIPVNSRGKATSPAVDVPRKDNNVRMEHATLLVLHMVARPLHLKPISCKEMAARKKSLQELE